MRPAFRSSLSRRLLVWLLAGLLPLQALAAMAIATRGPSHSHLPSASTRLVLDDFRRAPVRRVSLETHGTSSVAHVHDAGAERHHHAPADPTVVIDDAERLQADEADDMSPSPALGAVFGLIASPPRWQGDATGVRAQALACWQPRTHCPSLPERPPRAIG